MKPSRKGWRILPGGNLASRTFEECLLPHIDALYSLALRLTRNADAADDLVQDTSLRAFEKFHQLRERVTARAWLVRILTTTFLNRYAGRSGVAASEADELRPDEEPVLFETPESLLLSRCDAEEIEAALAELPEEFRLTVLLADVEDLPLRDIAALCGCPPGTVASRLARGRRLLRDRLGHLRGKQEVDA